MPLINKKPTTNGKRNTKLRKFTIKEYLPEDISKEEAQELVDMAEQYSEKAKARLTKNLPYKAGRNSRGVITSRRKGGRVKRKYRQIDFKRDKYDVYGTVVSVEYDPNRSADIALIKYDDGEFRYILAPKGIKLGNRVVSSKEIKELRPGNAYPLSEIPAATFVHNVELVPNQGAQLGRSAGTVIQVQGNAGKGYVQIKLPSGEIRLVKASCYATIGFVGNKDHSNQKYGKAGRMRRKGIRPTVRGVAQSYKHPHGGGQGKGGRHGTGGPARDPWGNKRGKITRTRRHTNKFIIKRRTSRVRPKNKPYKTIV
jgi:large subunit ribosomal protein L2